MAINDKLKGAYYRAPVTKLASRSAIMKQLNELIDYFNSLNEMLSTSFDKVTETRTHTVGLLERMQVTILHFKYILDNYHDEIDVHIAERIAQLIDTFTSSFDNIVENYDVNLFNHTNISDDYASNSTKNEYTNLEEWDKSISMNSSDLGIRWFGGKFSDTNVMNEIANVFRVVKINTYDGKINEDVINSNPVLELFVRTPKGMSWLVLGQNGSFGHNIIVKYQSKALINDVKVMSENFYTPKEYDINQFDINMFVKMLLTQDDLNGSNVYIKVRTNIPSNTESGREGYYVSTNSDGATKLENYSELRSIVNTAKKMLYEDNKDIQILKRDDVSISDISEVSPTISVTTEEMINPASQRTQGTEDVVDAETESFFTEVKNKMTSNNRGTFDNGTFNPDEIKMNTIMDTVDGRVTHHEEIVDVADEFYDEKRFDNTNKKFDKDSKAKYFAGEQITDMFDYRNVGKVSLIAKNENMFEVDGKIGNSNPVIQNDAKYGDGKSEKTVYNKLFNNSLFDSLANTDYIERKFRVLVNEPNDFEINCIAKTESLGTLLGTTKGVYMLEDNKGFVLPASDIACIAEMNGVVYLGTKNNDGIYKWESVSKTFVKTNIIAGNFTTFAEITKPDIEEKTLVAFTPNGSYERRSDIGKYDLLNSFYILYPAGWLSEHDVSIQQLTNDTSIYRIDSAEVANGMTGSSEARDQKWKIIFNGFLKRYFILNMHTGYVACTKNDSFMNFRHSIIHERFGSNIKDLIFDGTNMYISVQSVNESNVYMYDGVDFQLVEFYNYKTKNDRNIVNKAVYLKSIASLNR